MLSIIRAGLTCLFALCLAGLAQAEERIEQYDIKIEVQTDGDILVTETISVVPEHRQINRGIYRALPRYYELEGERFRYDYKVLDVTRNGKDEPYSKYREGNGYYIRIGDEDVMLPFGELQTYQIHYRAKNQIRYFEDHDELYWNATGTYWTLPMGKVTSTVSLPEGAQPLSSEAYTGAFGETGSDYSVETLGNKVNFTVTRPLARREGLSVVVSLPKGVIDPPSAADKRGILWQRYGGLLILVLTAGGVLFYYLRTWRQIGVDAPKLPVFPRYYPPEGLSPAAAHHIYYRSFNSNKAFAATLIDLAIKGFMDISSDKNKVTLTRKSPTPNVQMANHQRKLFNALLKSSDTKVIGGKYDSGFAASYKTFLSDVSRAYGEAYFKWNRGASVLAILLSVGFFVLAVGTTVNWTTWHTVLLIVLVAINIAFLYFLPAQTRKGEETRAEIAGFRLYLETAEKLQMNAADIHGDQPPPMSTERYEELLPYAIALDVEKPWSKYFEDVLPDAAKAYQPGWNNSAFYTASSLHGLNESLTSSISSGVSSAAVKPSSSSGSGGGGFSGGGGGGGGGGGW